MAARRGVNIWRLPEGGLPLPDPQLHDVGAGITLRAWTTSDAPALVAAWADIEIARRLQVPDDPTIEHAEHWIAGGGERRRHGLALDLVVVDVDDRVLGEVGLSAVNTRRAAAAIGWWTTAGARGRGVASTAVVLLTDWSLTTLGFAVLVAEVGMDNPASSAVAERAGYRRLLERTDGTVVHVAQVGPTDRD
jgi:RimJ/RimL family protein N-acetyltransferase